MGLLTAEQRARIEKFRVQAERIRRGGISDEILEDAPITAALKETFAFSCGSKNTAQHIRSGSVAFLQGSAPA